MTIVNELNLNARWLRIGIASAVIRVRFGFNVAL